MSIMINNREIPPHIGIIMDGNGRWATKRMMPRQVGHKKGAEVLEETVNHAKRLGVKHLTVYAFSTENWQRSKDEVSGLMQLLSYYLDEKIGVAEKDTIKMDVIGDTSALSEEMQAKIERLEKITKDKKGLNLHIALNYGGRNEILRAAKKMCEQYKNGEICLDDVSESHFNEYLDTKGIPDVDLVIRTSGEQRLSNFLLWQSAYAELYFMDKFWPDFTEDDLKQSIVFYQTKKRRFGGK